MYYRANHLATLSVSIKCKNDILFSSLANLAFITYFGVNLIYSSILNKQ